MPTLESALVISNNQVSTHIFEMELAAPQIVPFCEPGQFVHLRVNGLNDPLLRRPLSLYDVDKNQGSITLLYKVVGIGTAALARIRAGEYVDLMGPLGRPFGYPPAGQCAVLVGGGVGIAPLLYLARRLQEKDCHVKVFYGTQSSSELVALDRFRQLGVQTVVATLDGEADYQGFVTDLLFKRQPGQDIEYLYTCGPEPMMAKVAEYAGQNGLNGEVSLEEYMACGVGACLGCARKLKDGDKGYIKVCKDGPVFGLHEVELNLATL
jgi:dihydroorotate dehydrogenase electron transfer subunit